MCTSSHAGGRSVPRDGAVQSQRRHDLDTRRGKSDITTLERGTDTLTEIIISGKEDSFHVSVPAEFPKPSKVL